MFTPRLRKCLTPLRLALFTVLALTLQPFTSQIFCQTQTQTQTQTAPNATLDGTVLDPTGTALAGAHLLLTGRGSRQSILASPAGTYLFAPLPPGLYTLSVDAPGFTPSVQSSLALKPGMPLHCTVRLALQAAAQSVTVQSEELALDQVPSVGKTGTLLQDLPQSVSLIGHRLSEAQGNLVLAETIRNASGITQGGTDGFGFADRLQIRGLEARIYNDGFSDGDQRNGIPHSLNGVERVEILEGPGSSLFGSGPPGGTINLVHFTPAPRFSVGTQFQTGSFGLYAGSAYLTGSTPVPHLDYRIDTLLQHKQGYRALAGAGYELRPVLSFTSSHNLVLLAIDARYLQATPDSAGLVYFQHTPIASVPAETKYSTPFGFGNQSLGRATLSDLWQATPSITVNNHVSYMLRNLSILRNGDGGAVVGSALTGRLLRNQHDVLHDFDAESEPVFTFHTGRLRHTLLTGTEIQHQSILSNRATAGLQNIPNIFAPVIPETSRAALTFLRDATHSGFLDQLHANYEGLYATDQLDLTARWKLRLGGRQDFWQTTLAPQVFVPGRSLGHGRLIEPPNTFSRNDRPLSWNAGTVYRVLPGVSAFFGVAHSNLVNFTSEATQNGVQAPESGAQYEAGTKIAAFHNRLLLTAAAFRVQRSNVFSLVSDIPVFNDQLTQGGEGSLELALNRHWKMNANATGMHAALTDNPSNPAATGRRPQGVPNRLVNLWTSYDLHPGPRQTISLAGGFSNRSSEFADVLNTNAIPSYTTADAVANFHTHAWDAAFGIRNLTNTRYFTAANGVGGFVGDARSYFGKVQYQLGNAR